MTTRTGLNHIDIVGPLLPITGAFAVPFTAYFALLSARVCSLRLKEKIFLGDAVSSDASPEASATTTDDGKHHHDHDHDHHRHHHPLFVATRSHANFVEHVPLALTLAAFAELNGGSKQALTLSLGGLLVARVLHVEFGLRRPGSTGFGRVVGYYGTMGVTSFLAGYAGWLVKDYWFAK
ncbi:membrane-associated, eicosanoid/glutathione metabolism protein [Cercophora newfieldiana]|uniref:Membrane-associated, eicosanoid/glutathione metabolism protein n=1 Tax=Cercophora newfieldiana TaxID=92897 RepID=A0AA39XVX7_9PEZI|nr:membrane-associated, eicosanoid/glutathione metabolism protein [Cercophora newfieldiana]